MSERERLLAAYESKKAKAISVKPDQKKRDWIAFVISIVSLSISVVSFFFSTLLEIDDIKLIISEIPRVDISNGIEANLVLDGPFHFAIINSGNRSGAIMSLNGFLRNITHPWDESGLCITKDSASPRLFLINILAEPFVIKSGEIQNVVAGKFGGVFTTEPGAKSVYLQKDQYAPKEGDKFLLCLEATVATPDGLLANWRLPLVRYEVETFESHASRKAYLTVDESWLLDKNKPIIVTSNSRWFGKIGSIFSDHGSAPVARY